jgi:putative heme iron utilization protein
MSELAEHTKNVRHDARASVMVSSTVSPGDDPMALPRVTLLGSMEIAESVPDGFIGRFVAAHPTTASYVGFGDFHWWRLAVSAVRYVGGYGRMSWVPVDDYRRTDADPLHPHAEGIVAHMNDDHADACLVYAQFYAGLGDATSARLLGVDQFGLDLLATTPNGLQPTRVAFDEPETTPEGVRRAVVALFARARKGGAS